MPRYRVKGTVSFPGHVEQINRVYEAKNEKEANRKFNADVQFLKKTLKAETTSKPDVTITLE